MTKTGTCTEAKRLRAAAHCPGLSGGPSPVRVTTSITSVYLQGTDNAEIIDTVHTRRAPMIPVSTSLRL